jgi:hypothetical protein
VSYINVYYHGNDIITPYETNLSIQHFDWNIDFDTIYEFWIQAFDSINKYVENNIKGTYQQLFTTYRYIIKQLHAINSFLISHFIELSIKFTILQKIKIEQRIILNSNLSYIFKILANIFNKKDSSKNHISL